MQTKREVREESWERCSESSCSCNLSVRRLLARICFSNSFTCAVASSSDTKVNNMSQGRNTITVRTQQCFWCFHAGICGFNRCLHTHTHTHPYDKRTSTSNRDVFSLGARRAQLPAQTCRCCVEPQWRVCVLWHRLCSPVDIQRERSPPHVRACALTCSTACLLYTSPSPRD